MAIEKTELRAVMGHFATGIAVIASRDSAGVLHGLTANAFASLSLLPPLCLVCIDKKSDTHLSIKESKVFTVNILSEFQEPLARRFAAKGGDKFEGVSYAMGASNTPILSDVIAFVECKICAIHDGGDHTIFVGEILRAEAREGRPLLFFGGRYHTLGENNQP